MNTTIFFAQYWGWVTVIVTFMFFARPSVLHEVKTIMVKNRGFQLMYGIVSILVSLPTVILHNVWVLSWPVIITLIAWLALIKGVICVMWPEVSQNAKYEFRIKSTRIALGIVCILAIVALVISYKL